MTNKANIRIGTPTILEMARVLILMMAAGAVGASSSIAEMALTNITRFSTGDYFSLMGSECGPTRCMEVTHGTALTAIGTKEHVCRCQCRSEKPAFREDQGSCVNHIEECLMATFGHEAEIPLVYLPHIGQIIYPAKEIVFTNVDDAICAVTSAQYLSSSGWMTLRDLVDNDVPFGLYRDEGNTFLQWRGSSAIHARLEGRLVAVHVLCSATSSGRLVASCAAFRIAGTSSNSLLDVRSIPFHSGEIVTETPPSQGLSVIESLAIGVCVLLLVFVYAAGIIFYVHYKQRYKRKPKDPEQHHTNTMSTDNGSLESRIDMSNVMLKTNPLLQLNGMNGEFFHDSEMPDISEHTEDNLDTQNNQTNSHKFQKLNANVISAMVHSRRKKTLRPSIRSTTPERVNERFQRRSMSPDALERAPHSDLSIVDCSMENNFGNNGQLPPSNGETVYRKKLYFNPVFFETEHLKNPPPAAIEFLMKIREVMSVAKEKMTSKRFMPILSDIPEEDLYQAIDLGWDIPCARRGRRFSAISLKQENSRKSAICGGCPGCDNSSRHKAIELARSNSCKTCVSEDYKQKIVRKWLDEVPLPNGNNTRPVKSVANINGTLRNIEMKQNEIMHPKSVEQVTENPNKLLPDLKSNKKEAQPNIIESKSVAPEIQSKLKENKSSSTEIKPKLVDIKMKSSETEPKTKPKITEMITKESRNKTSKDKNMKEMKSDEKKILKRPINVNEIEIIKLDDKDGSDIEKISKPVVTTLEKTSPTPNHTSRRIRKKLPPPPPPPVTPPRSPESEEDKAPIPPEVKVKMEAVIRQIKTCRRVEPTELEDVKMETIAPIGPKLIIPVLAADSQYYSDDNLLTLSRKKDMFNIKENFMEFDSLERNAMKRRRFSVACTQEIGQRNTFGLDQNLLKAKDRLTSTSCRDMKKAVEEDQVKLNGKINIGEVFINNNYIEPIYDNVDDLIKPGPLTIQVRGSPVESRRNFSKDDSDFDPDTLDRRDTKKRVEKILLKSAGSFKYKSTSSESECCPKSPIVTRKICNLRQIYEAKAKAQEEEIKFFGRRQSIAYGQDLSAFMRSVKAPDLIRHLEGQKDPKPPIPPKQRRGSDLSSKFTSSMRESPSGDRRRMIEDRERFQQYTRLDNINARRSGRRSARTRSRRTDLRKLYRTEDSGYMSTDSNESKRRAKYLMQLRPIKALMPEPVTIPTVRVTTKTPVVQVDSDTDDLESLCDGRSESGGESVETDSVFFGNFDDSKEMFAELGLSAFEPQNKMVHTQEQIDSGFMGEVNIILSGDSDSEHRSVISIKTGHDGRASAASISQLDDAPYMQTIEC